MKYYKLSEVDHFSELHFEWSSLEDPNDGNLVSFSPKKTETPPQVITCAIGSPALHLITVPLSVQVRNYDQIERVLIHRPFTVEYEVTNISDDCVLAQAVLSVNEYNGKAEFMVAGELESMLYLMPAGVSEPYILRFTFFPQRLGRQSLPKFTILDRSTPKIMLIKEFTKKIYVTSN